MTEEEGKQKPGITTFLLNFLSTPHGSEEQMERGAPKPHHYRMDDVTHWQDGRVASNVVHLVCHYLQGNTGQPVAS